MVFFDFRGSTIEITRSGDGGVTYGTPIEVTFVSQFSDREARDANFLPSATVDPVTGNLYITYQARFESNPRIMFTRSVDGGISWSAPIAISDAPPADDPGGIPAFNPAIGASPGGQRLGVVFYDKRDDPEQRFFVDLYMTESIDGGLTWGPDFRVTDVSSDMRFAPLTSQGYMLGDYQGIAPSVGPEFPAVPIWIDTRNSMSDPFGARVSDPAEPCLLCDTDGDGIRNDFEMEQGTDPNDPSDKPPLGDPNDDSQIDNVDAIMILSIFVGTLDPEGVATERMDVDLNGIIDNVDAVVVFQTFLRTYPLYSFFLSASKRDVSRCNEILRNLG